jgi:hypothetical protein
LSGSLYTVVVMTETKERPMTTTLERSLPELVRELDETTRTLRAMKRRAEALAKIIEGVRELNGHASTIALPLFTPERAEPADEAAPRGREAVRLAVGERPGHIWTLPEIVSELHERGWLTNRKATEVAVHRMVNTGEARRVGHGVYEFPAASADQDGEP